MAEPANTAQEVAVRGPDDEIVLLRPSQVRQAIEAGGELATPEEVQHEKLQAEYGGLGGQARTFAEGAASGLTFGGSDALIAGLGGREGLQARELANPNARTAGEVAGIGGSLLIPGLGEVEGAGLGLHGLQAATALPRGVAGAGRLAERGIASVLEREGAGLAERTAVKGLSTGASGAVEGAAYGAAHEVSDAAINDHDLTAEKLMAGAKHGALWGAGAGAALGMGGELLSSGAGGLADAIAKHAKEPSLAEVLDRTSGEMAFRAAGGGKAVAKAADKFGEGYAQVGRVWRDEAPGLVGKSSFAEMSREDLRLAASAGMKREGARLGEDLATMTKKAPLPSAMSVVADIEDVARQVGTRAGQEGAVAKLQAFADSVKRITGIADASGQYVAGAGAKQLTFEELRNFRVDADNMWKGAARDPSLTGSTKFFGDVRNSLEDRLLAGAEEAGVQRSYLAAKNKYQAFSLLNRATDSGVAAQGSNRFFSLTDNLATHAGAVAGGIVGGPIGTAIGAGLGGVMSRAVRTRGDFLAADLLNRVTTLGGMQRMSASVDRRITQGVRDFMLGTGETAEAKRAPPAHHETLAQTQQIAQAAKNPALFERRVREFTGSIGTVAPHVTAAIAAKAAVLHSTLAPHMPKPYADPMSLTPQFTKWRASEMEVAKAAKFIEGATDPLSILDDLKRGDLSRDKIEAVRQGYPGLFAQIQETIAEEAPKLQKELSYEQKLRLEILLGVPTDQSLTPEFIAAIQASKAQDAPPPEKAPKSSQGGSRRPMKLDAKAFDPNPTRT